MQIHVNTDSHIDGREALVRHVEAEIATALERFSDQITRVEVHLSDQNGSNSGDADKRCLIEARLAGHPSVVVTHDGATGEEALDGAAKKLHRSLASILERAHDHKGAASIRTEQGQ